MIFTSNAWLRQLIGHITKIIQKPASISIAVTLAHLLPPILVAVLVE